MASLVLREAGTTAELRHAERILDAAGLPTADIRTDGVRIFLAVDDGTVVGVGGFEPAGDVGLLRSVAVRADHRNAGFGAAICSGIEEIAATAGVDLLFLLTTGAAAFFAGLGYDRRDRTGVPEPIRETRQFQALCPDSATCMAKRVGDDVERSAPK